MKFKFILAMLLAIPVADAAASDQGYYSFLNFGRTKVSGFCNTLPSTVTCRNNEMAAGLGLGYQFDPTWAVELSYENLISKYSPGTITSTSPNGSTIISPYGVLLRIRGTLLTGVATIPLSQRWSLITKSGSLRLANMNVLVETPNGAGGYSHIGYTGLGLYWGIGTQYDFTSSYAIRALYEDFGTVGNASTGRFGVKVFMLGLIYKFY